jgi:hypothetical protein
VARLCVFVFLSFSVFGQGAEWIRANYTKFEHRIAMRDGRKLFTSVYVPKDRGRRYPFLMVRTPYGVAPYGADDFAGRLGPDEKFARAGYIFVQQDVRGRYESEGVFVEMTPHRAVKRTSADVDESTDTYDTIEWLVRNVAGNNGRAGIYGTSYPGFYAAAGMIDAHPALKAASPQAPIVDLFRGDDAYHNGAFYLAANFGFYTNFHEHKEPQRADRRGRFDYDTPDGYEFHLNLGPLANADERHYRFQNKYWTDLLHHTSYDEFWKTRNLEPHIRGIKPAVLAVGGWYDAEDLQGPLTLARAATANAPQGPVTLVMGPWVHGGWNRGDGERLGAIPFGSKTAAYFRENIEFPFFECHLKNKCGESFPAAWLFETGRNEWRRFDKWPPAAAQRKTLYFRAGGALSFEAPDGDAPAFDEYVSDPAKPVPFTSFVTLGMSQLYMVDDQRHAARRTDVVTYQTEPLESDVTVGGPITAKLHVSTSGSDSDFVVKLIDVWPDDAQDAGLAGYQQLVRGEPFRGRFRKGFEKPVPLPANEFVRIEYVLPDVLHTFRRGHRVMVQVQSSWFPLIDRNPQTFVESIPHAKPSDFRKATQRVARWRAMASGVEVLVIP